MSTPASRPPPPSSPGGPPLARLGDRSLFPDLACRSYLAHCAISPASRPVRAIVTTLAESYGRAGVGALAQWMEQRARLHGELAALIGAQADDIGFVANTTTGLTQLANSLPWRAGDKVVLFHGEFPANVTPWLQAARTYGLEVAWVPLDGFGRGGDAVPAGEGLTRLEAALRAGGVRLVAVSAVQFQTGLRMPLRAIADLCHRYGAELCVDAIQAVGVVPIDVADGIDYLACGSHKWLMGLEGCGFVYVSPTKVGALVPRLAGWLSHEDPVGFLFGGPGSLTYDRPFRARADVFEGAALNGAGFAALGAAVGVLAPLGIDAVYTHVQAWHDAIEPHLVERGWSSLRSPDPAARSGILAVTPPRGVPAGALVAPLKERGVVVSAPEGCLRLAPSWPNALDEVPGVLGALDAVLAAG